MALKSNQRTIEAGDYVLFHRQAKLRSCPFELYAASISGTGTCMWSQSFIKDSGRVLVNPGMKGYTGATPSMIDATETESSSHAGVGHSTNQGEAVTAADFYYAWNVDAASASCSSRASSATEQHYAQVIRILGTWVELDFGSMSTTYSNWPAVCPPSRGGTNQRIKYGWMKLNQIFRTARIYDAEPRSS